MLTGARNGLTGACNGLTGACHMQTGAGQDNHQFGCDTMSSS
jgi:hypothetical protein